MKTYKDIKKLNFNDVAFFTGVSTSEAKWNIAHFFYKTEKLLNENITKTGVPKLTINDYIDVNEIETKIKSSTVLDGFNNIEHIVNTYNKGVPLTTLMEYAENKAFIKSLKFTGKYSILNDILNSDQLEKLRKLWLLRNCYHVKNYSKNTIKFIRNNCWAISYLVDNGILKDEIERNLENGR